MAKELKDKGEKGGGMLSGREIWKEITDLLIILNR